MSSSPRLVVLSRASGLASALAVAGWVGVGCSPNSRNSPDTSDAGCFEPPHPGGDVCNAIINAGTTVTVTCEATLPPPMTGGTVLDGMYILTSETRYGCDGGKPPVGAELDSAAVVISGRCIHVSSFASGDGGNTALLTETGQITFDENRFFVESRCGDLIGGPFDVPTYTATGTTLSIV